MEDIRALLARGGSPVQGETTIATGTLTSASGELVRYEISHGWNLMLACACDDAWGAFNMKLLRFIKAQRLDERALMEVLDTVQLDDSHWRWGEKALAYAGERYDWFFLTALGKPQAACLIYRPKPSMIDGKDIFYIEYLAVAPWNRENPMAKRRFKGLGRLLVDAVCHYAEHSLALSPGFALHALPRAEGFYQQLGMQRIAAHDKDSLSYFELDAEALMHAGSMRVEARTVPPSHAGHADHAGATA